MDPESSVTQLAQAERSENLHTLTEDAAGAKVEAYLTSPTAKQGANETPVGTGKDVPWTVHEVAKDKAGGVLESIFQKICSKESLKGYLEEPNKCKKK